MKFFIWIWQKGKSEDKWEIVIIYDDLFEGIK